MKTVFLHVGTSKTGTSTIQSFCRENRGALAERGLCHAPNPVMHHDVVHSLTGRKPSVPAGLLGSALEDFEASPCRSLLLSAETFFKHAFEILPERLPANLARFRVVVVCYARRTDEYVASRYSTSVAGRARRHWYPSEYLALRPTEYHAHLRRLLDVFQADDAVLRSFDRASGDLLGDFFATVIGSVDPGLRGRFAGGRKNVRLSSRQVLLLRWLNELGVSNTIFMRTRNRLRQMPDSDTRSLLALEQRQALAAQFNREVDALNRDFNGNLQPVAIPTQPAAVASTLHMDDLVSLWPALPAAVRAQSKALLGRSVSRVVTDAGG